MTQLAPTLQAFFTERLLEQRKVSPHTIASYRDSLRLLLRFAQQRTGKPPNRLDFADVDAPLIGAFLAHLDNEPREQPGDQKRAALSDPLAVPLRRFAPPRARSKHRPRARDPRHPPPQNHDRLPRPQ